MKRPSANKEKQKDDDSELTALGKCKGNDDDEDDPDGCVGSEEAKKKKKKRKTPKSNQSKRPRKSQRKKTARVANMERNVLRNRVSLMNLQVLNPFPMNLERFLRMKSLQTCWQMLSIVHTKLKRMQAMCRRHAQVFLLTFSCAQLPAAGLRECISCSQDLKPMLNFEF